MTIEIGRIVTKIAGRDAGKKAVITDILDDKYVLIDGETRRRKVNILHIEPSSQVIKIEKNASHEEVAKALKEIGIEARQTKPKPKTQKPKKKRKSPEQLRTQKEEKRKFRDFFKPKEKEVLKPSLAPPSAEKAEAKEGSLEEKAGLIEEKKEEDKIETKEEKKPAKKTETKKTTVKKKTE